MRTTRQEYKDAPLEQARKQGYDTVQLKYDGWWFRTEVLKGVGTVYTRTGRPLPDFSFTIAEPINATVIGEGMYGTNWSQKPSLKGRVFCYDLWSLNGQDLEALPYKERYKLLKTVMPFLPPNYIRVENFDTLAFDTVWRMFVESGDFEGVVFRRRNDPVGATLLRHKLTIHDEYKCVGFVEGQGKYAGTLGALVIGDKVTGKVLYASSGEPATVGGGFEDTDRDEIWNNQARYLNRNFEAEGKARFPSGLLRHPNIVRWKDA